MGDRHDECMDKDCLCRNNNHGTKKETLKDGVKINQKMNNPDNEPREYETALVNQEKLKELLDKDESSEYSILELIKLLIVSRHLVSIIDIMKIIGPLCNRRDSKIDGNGLVEVAFSDPDIFTLLTQICFKLGQRKKKILFENGQLIEVSWYLMGRYHIKRIELTGSMLFFNDKFYKNDAEQLIRRKAREILIKSKNSDMNEIVRMVEDSCKLIIWKDIEESIHLKCLLNGIYNIKTGEFIESFNPDYIILNQIPHKYDKNATFEEIDKVISQIISNDNDRQSYYDSLSTALHPYTGIDFQFGGIGKPGTGKSQVCFLSGMVLGEDNVSSASIHQIASDLTTQKDVAFKFLNIDQDMSDEAIKNIDVLKRWITQDKFTARGIYEHNTTFRPTARLCFMANSLYEIANSDDAEAIYERTHIIKIENKFRFSEGQRIDIMKKVATESELVGFITYLLNNATEIWKNQKIHHPIKIQTVKDTWNLHGNRIKEFITTHLVKGVAHRTDQVDVWNRWLSFANRKEYPAKNKKTFHSIFDEIIGNSPAKTSIEKEGMRVQIWAYSGFRLLSDKEVAENETLYFDSDVNMVNDKKTILELLDLGEIYGNNTIIETKITELLELAKLLKK